MMTRVGNLEKKNGPVSISISNSNGRGGGEKTIVVGVKLDTKSKELLTWALVKLAQPGDRVVAVHVLKHPPAGEFHAKENSSVFCLVNAFHSVLSAYEGFCNLKQVDLKVKISRGSSIRKMLVQEAKLFGAATVIVGTTKNTALGSTIVYAKYCAGHLPRSCTILALNNGKVIYERAALPPKSSDDTHRTKLFSMIHRTLSKSSKSLSNSSDDASTTEGSVDNSDWGTCSESDSPTLTKVMVNEVINEERKGQLVFDHVLELDSSRPNCIVCGTERRDKSGAHDRCGAEDCNDYDRRSSTCSSIPEEETRKSLALVPVQKLEGSSSSISLLIKELPELRPGWPLLRRTILPCRGETRPAREISVVQWAMQLPSRYSSVSSSHRKLKKENGFTGPNPLLKDLAPLTSTTDVFSSEMIAKMQDELTIVREKYASNYKLFAYDELLNATSNFSSDNLVGKGGSSRVFRGTSDGEKLAVKILKFTTGAWKQFLLEIEILTALKHDNVISLIGFCFENDKLVLVYNFLPRGSLEENLHGKKDKKISFSWAERYKVALGVARALDYLHSGSSKPVIHRDVKSSNILLSDDFEPKLADFGLAELALTASNILNKDVAGTFGYLAPEYFMYGKVNEKIDVYSFGVVLLELLTGRKPISDEYPIGQQSLVMWAMPLLQKREVEELLDSCLDKDYDVDQAEEMMLAASLCLRHAPRLRPKIGLILKLLEGDEDALKWARSQVISTSELDVIDEEPFTVADMQSYLDLALLDVDENSLAVNGVDSSFSHVGGNKLFEDYLRKRGISSIG